MDNTSNQVIDNTKLIINHPNGMLDRDQRTIQTISQSVIYNFRHHHHHHYHNSRPQYEPDKYKSQINNKNQIFFNNIILDCITINYSKLNLDCIPMTNSMCKRSHQKNLQQKGFFTNINSLYSNEIEYIYNITMTVLIKMPLNEFYSKHNIQNSFAIPFLTHQNNLIEEKEELQQQKQNNNVAIPLDNDKNTNCIKKGKNLIKNKNVANTNHFLSNNSTYSSILNNSENNRILLNRNEMIKTKRHNNISAKFNLINFNKMKLSNLLFCILICLSVLVQRTSSKPITMNGNSNNHNDNMQQSSTNGENFENNKCGRILDSFDKIRQQAIVAYNEINGERLNDYVSKIFNLTHDQQHNEWKQTHFLWLYPKGYPNNGILPYDDYTQPIPVEQLHHLRNTDRQSVENELTELFKRMNLISAIARKIENIIQTEKNAHRKYGSSRNHRSVRNYFETQAKMADDVIKEVEYAFRQLGLKKPELNEPINVTDQELKNEVIHWVVTREHLKLLNYVRSAFEEIQKNDCF